MFFAAAKALAGEVSEADLEQGRIYPPLTKIRDASVNVSSSVADVAYDQGLARKSKPSDLLTYIRSQMYDPKYHRYV